MTPSEAAVKLLALAVPETEPLFDEHTAAYAELLPTVFFGELAEWVSRSLHEERDVEPASAALQVMEYLLVAGASDVKDLVATGFLEGLPSDELEDDRLGTLLGPALCHDLTRSGRIGRAAE